MNGSADGRFTIPNVRPGTYVLRAFANGVLGEYDRTAKVTVEAGKNIDPGQTRLAARPLWQADLGDRLSRPHRRQVLQGRWRQLLAVGLGAALCRPLPQRRHLHHRQEQSGQGLVLPGGAALHHHGLAEPGRQGPLQPALRLGSNIPATKADPWPQWGRGRATTWTVKFNMAKASQGTAVLRIALAGADSTTLTIGVNGQTVGTIRPVATNALRYNTNKGVWNQYIVKFDASLMKAGANEMTFTVPAGRRHHWRRMGLRPPGAERWQQDLSGSARQSKARLSDSRIGWTILAWVNPEYRHSSCTAITVQ